MGNWERYSAAAEDVSFEGVRRKLPVANATPVLSERTQPTTKKRRSSLTAKPDVRGGIVAEVANGH